MTFETQYPLRRKVYY